MAGDVVSTGEAVLTATGCGLAYARMYGDLIPRRWGMNERYMARAYPSVRIMLL